MPNPLEMRLQQLDRLLAKSARAYVRLERLGLFTLAAQEKAHMARLAGEHERASRELFGLAAPADGKGVAGAQAC